MFLPHGQWVNCEAKPGHTTRQDYHCSLNILHHDAREQSITIKELQQRKVAAPVYRAENTAGQIRHADHLAPSIR
jgi:hypothetical protein